MSLWSRFRSKRSYELSRLVDQRSFYDYRRGPGHVHMICDIDKTYLETEFDSILDLAKVAIENAGDKVTVPGAADVLLAGRWAVANASIQEEGWAGGNLPWPFELHFVSSSPPQLRKVLEQKLSMDGLDWTSDTFKDQAYNLQMRRMDLLKQHVAYKSAAIIEILRQAGDGARIFMIGDCAESDPYIYVGVALLAKGLLTPSGYQRYLGFAGVEDDVAGDVVDRLEGLPRVQVEGIFIRNLADYTFVEQAQLTQSINRFSHFFEVALLLTVAEILTPGAIKHLVRSAHNDWDVPRKDLVAMLRSAQAEAPLNAQDGLAAAIRYLGGSHGLWPDVRESSPLRFSIPADFFTGLNESEVLQQAQRWSQNLAEARVLRKQRSRGFSLRPKSTF